MMKLIYTIFLGLFIPLTLFSQNFSNQWTGHYSYTQIRDVSSDETKVYAAAENALLIYDTETNSTETLSTVEGLSGQSISAIHRSADFELTLIGYENGLIEIVKDNEQDVTTLIDIRDKVTITPDRKKINSFEENESEVLIATGFGIVELNLNRLEFGDTFLIGPGGSQIEVTDTAFFDGFIYATTPNNGLLRANGLSPNLVDFNEWNFIEGGIFKELEVVNGNLYVQQGESLVRRINGTNITTVLTVPNIIDYMSVSSDAIMIGTVNAIQVYDVNFQRIATIGISNPVQSMILGENIYIGTQVNGIFRGIAQTNSSLASITPAGPFRNDPFALQFANNELWVTYGDFDVFFNPFPLKLEGINIFNSDQGWRGINRGAIFNTSSLVNVAVNPNNPEQVFVSSFQDGLLELNAEQATALYNSSNSGFETFVPGDEVIRLNGAAFNRDGNLWVVNSRVRRGLKLFNPETKNVTGIDITGAIASPENDPGFSKLVLDRSGNVFFGSGANGVVAYNPNDGIIRNISAGSGSSPGLEDVRALAVDQNNQLWIGTRGGLRVFFNTANVFEQSNPSSSNIVIDDNGVPQELLFEQFISDIEVDGSNNKWIATGSSGVFHVSSDGQQTLAHYTTENSPLPTNTVQDIAIDGETGKVFFATTRGLIEFNGSATDPNENLENVEAYPNPVRPNYNGMVTVRGLTARANVKITDIEGNLVYEEVSQGGSIQWDTTAFGRHRVASGVYLILVTAEGADETQVAKLMIIR